MSSAELRLAPVPPARGGTVTDHDLDTFIVEFQGIPPGASEYTVNGAFLRLLMLPLLVELRQHRLRMGAIRDLSDPGNVVVLERPLT